MQRKLGWCASGGHRWAGEAPGTSPEPSTLSLLRRALRRGFAIVHALSRGGSLGFTHYWGKSRKGHNVVKVKTAAVRFRRTLSKIREWGWEHRHLSMKDHQRELNERLRGHDAYFGVTGNHHMLSRLRWEVAKLWRKWLVRRNRGKSPNWEKFNAMLRTFPLLPARIVHSRM